MVRSESNLFAYLALMAPRPAMNVPLPSFGP